MLGCLHSEAESGTDGEAAQKELGLMLALDTRARCGQSSRWTTINVKSSAAADAGCWGARSGSGARTKYPVGGAVLARGREGVEDEVFKGKPQLAGVLLALRVVPPLRSLLPAQHLVADLRALRLDSIPSDSPSGMAWKKVEGEARRNATKRPFMRVMSRLCVCCATFFLSPMIRVSDR